MAGTGGNEGGSPADALAENGDEGVNNPAGVPVAGAAWKGLDAAGAVMNGLGGGDSGEKGAA